VGKKVKVVFDTNVWLSIFMEKRLKDEFSKVKQNLIVFVSEDIGLEVSKVLQYPKVSEVLKKSGIQEKDVLRVLAVNSKRVEPKLKLYIITEDPADNKILECAQASNADFILSGDKHLLELGKYRKTKIQTPREFFDSINRN
jgi:uncharacterized protein